MTKTNADMITNVLTHVFGECNVVQDDETSYYVEVKGACVFLMNVPIEVDSISGPVDTMGWMVAVEDEDGELEEEAEAQTLWEALGYAADVLSDQMIQNLRWDQHAEEVNTEEVV